MVLLIDGPWRAAGLTPRSSLVKAQLWFRDDITGEGKLSVFSVCCGLEKAGKLGSAGEGDTGYRKLVIDVGSDVNGWFSLAELVGTLPVMNIGFCDVECEVKLNGWFSGASAELLVTLLEALDCC
jgi:hypothetical protein